MADYINTGMGVQIGALPEVNVVENTDVIPIQTTMGTKKVKPNVLMGNIKDEINIVDKKIKNTNFSLQSKIPLVTFITDDGALEDITKLKPISIEKNIPFVTAVYKDCPTKNSLKELENLGWEIAGHHSSNLLLETQTYDVIKAKFQETINFAEELGCTISNHVYANGGHNELIRKVASELFDCCCQVGGGGGTGHTNIPPVFQYNLNRVALGSYTGVNENTLEYYKSKVDSCESEKSWLIFMLHPAETSHDATQQQYLRDTIDYIKSKNIPIVTLKKGIEIFGNKKIIGDYYHKTNSNNFYVEGCDSTVLKVENNFEKHLTYKAKQNSINASVLPDQYPLGVTHMQIVGTSGGYPSSGTVVTYKFNENPSEISHVWQVFKPFNARYCMERYCINNKWEEFRMCVNGRPSVTYNVPATTINPKATVSFLVDYVGADIYDIVQAQPYISIQNGLVYNAVVEGLNKVKLNITNITDSAINMVAKDFRFLCLFSK